MTKIKTLIVVAILMLSITVFGQNETELNKPERFNHSLGFGAGITTGYGLSYRYFGDKLGAQVNFSPYKDEQRTNISTGVTFLFRIAEVSEFTFFLYQGNHYYYNEESYTYTNYEYDYYGMPTGSEEITYSSEEKYFNNGIGIGLEWNVSERIGLNTMAGYGGQKNFEIISLTGEVAAYFRF